MVELAKGDIRNSLNLSFSRHTQRFIHTVNKRDGKHTVLWIRKEDLKNWRQTSGVAALRQCIGEVLAEEDGRRLFPDVYRRADEIKAQRKEASKRKPLTEETENNIPSCN